MDGYPTSICVKSLTGVTIDTLIGIPIICPPAFSPLGFEKGCFISRGPTNSIVDVKRMFLFLFTRNKCDRQVQKAHIKQLLATPWMGRGITPPSLTKRVDHNKAKISLLAP